MTLALECYEPRSAQQSLQTSTTLSASFVVTHITPTRHLDVEYAVMNAVIIFLLGYTLYHSRLVTLGQMLTLNFTLSCYPRPAALPPAALRELAESPCRLVH